MSFLDSCRSAEGAAGESDDRIVVFLHGLAGSARELVRSSEALGAGSRSVLVDLPGHGQSSRRPHDVSREVFVRAVVAVIGEVTRDTGGTSDPSVRVSRPENHSGAPRVVLVGQSMGAHTAMLVAAAHPRLVGGLVLLECSADGAPTDARRKLTDYFSSWPVPFADTAEAHAFLGRSHPARAWVDDFEPTRGGLVPRFDPELMGRIQSTLEEPRWEQWSRSVTPAIAVYGHDSMFEEAQQRAFVDARPGVRLVRMNSGSHDAHLDASEEWHETLRASIESLTTQIRT